MLTGYFKFGEYTVNLRGYDYGSALTLFLSCPLVKTQLLIDLGTKVGKGEDAVTYPPRWQDLYLLVASNKVRVLADVYTEDKVRYKSTINKPFFAKLGGIINGMKANCVKENREDLLEAMSENYYPNKVLTYIIPDKGKVSLDMHVLKYLEYKEGDLEMVLEEDGTYEEKVFPKYKVFNDVPLNLEGFIDEPIEDDWSYADDKIFTLQEIIERNPKKNYVWLKERKYHIIKTQKQLEEVCQKIWKFNGVVAFDTETTGLAVNVTSRYGVGDRLVGMVFSIQPGEAWYFPVAHKKIRNICKQHELKFYLDKYFKPILEKKNLLAHNGSFDWKVMYIYDICINLVHDLFCMLHLTMWNDHRSMELGLKPLTSQFLNRDSFELSDFVVGKFGKEVKFWDLDEESVKYYACPDTDNDLELFYYFMDRDILGEYNAKKVYELEMGFTQVIGYQEFYGHCVDVDNLDGLVRDLNDKIASSYEKMVEIVGHDFNPRSNKELPTVLYEELGLPILGRTDSGNPCTDKDVRKEFMKMQDDDGNMRYPIIKYLDEYLNAKTLESNFTKNIDKFATEDGLMFSGVKQFLETGRVSVSKPNYQSYNDEVKKYIIPRTGYYALDADYSSVEARIMCSMAGCTNMVNKLKDPDADYHTLKASDMFGVPYELVTPKLRKMSKGVNFGILYGLGDPNLGVNLFGKKTPENTRKAKQQKVLYFNGMDGLEQFISVSKSIGVEKHFSETYFNRRRYYDPRKTRIDTIERQACNARIQGTAADLYKIAMVKLFHEIKKRGLLGKILISAFVHDECFLEVHKSIDPAKMLKMLRECMMIEIEGWCPLFIGCGFGRNWYEAKKTEIPVQVQEYIVNEYSESGLDFWKGDTNELYEWQVRTINDYKRDRVINYLKNKDNWGKVFQPVENSLAHEVMSEVKSGRAVDGVITTDFECKSDMIENLEEFCKCFGCLDLFEKANVQRPVHNEPKSKQVVEEDDDEYGYELSAEELIKTRIKQLGVCVQRNEGQRELYFRYDDDIAMLNLVKKTIVTHPGDLPVYAVRNGEIFSTGLTTSYKTYNLLLTSYLTRANLKGRCMVQNAG